MNNEPETTKASLSELLVEAVKENTENWERVAKLEHTVEILINYLDTTVKNAFQELTHRVKALEVQLEAEKSYNLEKKEQQ